MQFHPYSLLLAVSALIALGVAAYGWRRRAAPGAIALALANLGLAEWAGAYGLQWAFTSEPAQAFWLRATLLGAAAAMPCMLAFALRYLHLDRWLTRPILALLAVHPALSAAVFISDPWARLYLASTRLERSGGLAVLAYEHGPWYWVTLAYGYLLVIAVVVLLLRFRARAAAPYRAQTLTILAALLFPFVGSFLTQAAFPSGPALDLTPVFFSLTGLALAYGLYRHRLLDLAPVGPGAIIENMDDGVLVLDAQDRVVEANPAARRLIGEVVVGEHVDKVLRQYPDVVARYGASARAQTEVVVNDARFEVRLAPLAPRAGGRPGRLIVWRNITERKHAETELRAANERLQAQLTEIETLQARLREEALRDHLTNLYNRRYLGETLPRELSRAAREHYRVTAVMVDIDHFKTVNDTYGHPAGDRVLQTLAEVLSANTRAGDLVCRYGGEEFVVVLPNTSAAQARQRAEAWRLAFAEAETRYEEHVLTTTLSAGVAEYRPRLEGQAPAHRQRVDLEAGEHAVAEALVRAADRAMYAAKQAGRNQVVLFAQ